jgi:hypothetical protein
VAERVLTQRELNRALLARQMLLERAQAPLPRVLERMGGLQAQYAPSMYIGLWSRVEGFERDALTKALERRSVVQGTLMRATIHLVSKGDYWPFAVGIRDARRQMLLKSARDIPPAPRMAALAERLRAGLREESPLSRAVIHDLLGKKAPVTNAVNMWLDLVRVPPSGTWDRRRADLYAAAEDWLGAENATPEEGVELLVRRYLGGFGPAPVRDIAEWAGLPPKELAPTLERMRLRYFRSESGDELVDLPRAPLPDPETPAPPRFIPTWDAILLVHARRTGVLPEEHRPKVFNVKTPQSTTTFMVDGTVAGTWKYEKGRLRVKPFGRLNRAAQTAINEESERLAALHS